MQIKALKTIQKGTTLYVGVFTARQLVKISTVYRWAPSSDSAYQRPQLTRRYGEIARYLREEEGVLPTSVLLSARPGTSLKFEPDNGQVEGATAGTLNLDDRSKLWVVDGQHRIGGLAQAIAGGGPFVNYPVPVTIIESPGEYFELLLFNIVNTRQRAIPKDIVDQHLRKMRETEGADMQKKRSAREYKQGRAAAVIEILNGKPGPWFQQIRVPGVPERAEGLLRVHSLVVSLEPVLDDSIIRAFSDEDLASLLATYWRAIEELMPDAFLVPEDYTVQKQVGIHVFHRIFPYVLRLCAELTDYSKDMMVRILGFLRLPSGQLAMDSDRWHKFGGVSETQDTRMGAMRGFADSMRRYLPPADLLKGKRK
jgi:DGQHR domain-containing protein